MDSFSKIKSRTELGEIRKAFDAAGKRLVFTNGCFDILHRGHVEYLQQARQLGDALIIGLNSDNSTRRLKGEFRPIVPQDDRAFILASLFAVDFVSVFDEDTPYDLISVVQPDILVKGGDYKIDDIVGKDIVEARGGKVQTIPFVANRSTTNIVQQIVELTQRGIFS